MGELTCNRWIEQWLSGRAEAQITRIEYIRRIKKFSDFCQKHGMNFETVKEEYRAARRAGFDAEQDFIDSWDDIINDWAVELKPNCTPLSLKTMLSVPKSFFSFHEIPVKVHLPRHIYVKYPNRDLTKDMIRMIFQKASQRAMS